MAQEIWREKPTAKRRRLLCVLIYTYNNRSRSQGTLIRKPNKLVKTKYPHSTPRMKLPSIVLYF